MTETPDPSSREFDAAFRKAFRDLVLWRRDVRRFGLGTLYRPGDPGSLEAAVRAAVARYDSLLDAVVRAAPELSWEHDRQVLTALYQRIG